MSALLAAWDSVGSEAQSSLRQGVRMGRQNALVAQAKVKCAGHIRFQTLRWTITRVSCSLTCTQRESLCGDVLLGCMCLRPTRARQTGPKPWYACKSGSTWLWNQQLCQRGELAVGGDCHDQLSLQRILVKGLFWVHGLSREIEDCFVMLPVDEEVMKFCTWNIGKSLQNMTWFRQVRDRCCVNGAAQF